MAPKNTQSETKQTDTSGAELTSQPLLFEGLTIQEWAARAKKAELLAESMNQTLEREMREHEATENELARYNRAVSPAMLDALELRLLLDTRSISLVDRDRLRQADITAKSLQDWLLQQRSAMAKLLVTEYPAIRIIGEKVMFGNGVFAPKGMVYSRELHPNQFAQIVGERQADIDYVWESSVKS